MSLPSISSEDTSGIDLGAVLRAALDDAGAGWSIGTFGAIAEFHQDQGEEIIVDEPARLTRATARGGIRLDPQIVASLRPIAYEMLSPKPHRWSQGLALCLPADAARRAQRNTLTWLGPDKDAIRQADQGGILFDLGLDLPQIDFCIRTGDEALVSYLNRHEGKSLFAPDVPVMMEILHRHPHRVALSAIGRAEVYQPIGGPSTGGVSPLGPHTHVLPKLLKSGRTHSANTPIPEGLMPCGSLHPRSPVMTPLGEDCPFDAPSFHAFQQLLQHFGDPDRLAIKDAAWRALEKGSDPAAFTEPKGRHERTALRIALRQAQRSAEHAGDAALAATARKWRDHFEPHPEAETNDDDDPPRH